MYCGHEFPPSEISSSGWTDTRNPKGSTALCPECGIDAVLGDGSGYPVTDIHFKARFSRRWFNGYSRMDYGRPMPPRIDIVVD